MKASLPFRDVEDKSDSGGLLWNSGEPGPWSCFWVSDREQAARAPVSSVMMLILR
jgi:hypothetical protein